MSNQPPGRDNRLNVMDDEIDLRRLWALLQDGGWLIGQTWIYLVFIDLHGFICIW